MWNGYYNTLHIFCVCSDDHRNDNYNINTDYDHEKHIIREHDFSHYCQSRFLVAVHTLTPRPYLMFTMSTSAPAACGVCHQACTTPPHTLLPICGHGNHSEAAIKPPLAGHGEDEDGEDALHSFSWEP